LPCALSQYNGKGHKLLSPRISSWTDLPVTERGEEKNGERKAYVTASALRISDLEEMPIQLSPWVLEILMTKEAP